MKKRILSALLVLVMVVTMIPAFVITGTAATTRDTSWYAENEATKTYTIQDAGDLLGFSDLLASGTTFEGWTLTLGDNITLNNGWTASATAPENGDSWANTTEKTFSGTFDGNGKTISGVYLNTTSNSVGIFGGWAKGATVKNLVVLNSYVAGKWGTGGIFGDTKGGTNIIENVYAEIDVQNSNSGVGGFVGRLYDTVSLNIKNCVYAGTAKTSYVGAVNLGGFVGLIDSKGSVNFTNVAFYGTIHANAGGTWNVGGILGNNRNGTTATFTNCISAGTVKNGDNDSTGAILGRSETPEGGTAPITYSTNCLYTLVKQGEADKNRPLAGVDSPSGCTLITQAGIASPTATVPAGFTAMPKGYPMPTTLVNTVWAQSSMATSYGGYQKGTSAENDGEIRLIGVVDVATDLESEFSAVGFDIEMILGNGNTWTNKTEGTAPVIYNLYTSVMEEGKQEATMATDLNGDYIFVATVNGINSEYTGDITFVVKTFHDDANGNRVYDDIQVIAYQAAANA